MSAQPIFYDDLGGAYDQDDLEDYSATSLEILQSCLDEDEEDEWPECNDILDSMTPKAIRAYEDFMDDVPPVRRRKPSKKDQEV